MKNHKILFVLACSALLLAGCNSNNGSSQPVSSDSASSDISSDIEATSYSSISSEPETTSESVDTHGELNPYFGLPELEGLVNAFPSDVVHAFLEFFDMGDINLPAPTQDGYWYYEQGLYSGYGNLCLTIEDNGTPGVNGIEDTYKATLEAQEFVVDSSEYDERGYRVAFDDYPGFELLFYTDGGEFTFDLYGPFAGHITSGYPVYFAMEFVKITSLTFEESDLVVPDVDGIWSSYVASTYVAGTFTASCGDCSESDVMAYHDKMSAIDGVTIVDIAEEYEGLFDGPAYSFEYRAGGVEISIWAYLDGSEFVTDLSVEL